MYLFPKLGGNLPADIKADNDENGTDNDNPVRVFDDVGAKIADQQCGKSQDLTGESTYEAEDKA